MKKIIYLSVVFTLSLFIGIVFVSAKTYTINDYIEKLKSNKLTANFDEYYSVAYDENTKKIIMSIINQTSNQSNSQNIYENILDYQYVLDYDEDTDTLKHVNTQTINDLQIIDNMFSSMAFGSLFEMHGYDIVNLDKLGIIDDDSNLYNDNLLKYGIKVDTKKIEYQNNTQDSQLDYSVDLITSIEMKLNAMEDYVPSSNDNETNNSKNEENSEKVNSNEIVENPKTVDSNPFVISVSFILLISIVLFGIKKINKSK